MNNKKPDVPKGLDSLFQKMQSDLGNTESD